MKADDIITVKREISTAILVDGGFYRKRAYYRVKNRQRNELMNYTIIV